MFGFSSVQIFQSDVSLNFDLEVEPYLDPFLLIIRMYSSYDLSSICFHNASSQAFVDFYFKAEHLYLALNFRKTKMSSLLNCHSSLSSHQDLRIIFELKSFSFLGILLTKKSLKLQMLT